MIVARITELKKEEQNQIGLYLFNIINTFGKVNVLKKINYNSYWNKSKMSKMTDK